jgi:hypothetical protein
MKNKVICNLSLWVELAVYWLIFTAGSFYGHEPTLVEID